MKFDTIEQFDSLVPNCPFCGSRLKTELSPRTTPNFSPRYTMTFTNTTFADPFKREYMGPFNPDGSKRDDQDANMTYSSEEHGDVIVFQYDYLGRSHPIFSVDRKTNKILMGDLARVQKVVWDHKLHLMRFCDSTTCSTNGNRYMAESSLLVLERLNKRFCPFHLSVEMVAITPKERMYGLITPYNNVKAQQTFLVAINKNEIISQLPLIHIHKIPGGEVIANKIRTLITFS